MKEIFHNFIVPIALGVCLTMAKLIADGQEITLDESNGIALDIILVSIGTFTIFMKGKDIEVVIAAAAGNAVAAIILLVLRYRRAKESAKLPAGQKLPVTSWLFGGFQLGLGILAFIWTTKAF
jgi:hypothetical protein